MNPVDAVVQALTPGSLFNQNGRIFRSAKALAQFAGTDHGGLLEILEGNLAEQVTVRPKAKRPENGFLVALKENVPDQQEPAEGPQVKVVGGNAVPAPQEDEEDAAPDQNPPAKGSLNVVEIGDITGELESDEDEPLDEGYDSPDAVADADF